MGASLLHYRPWRGRFRDPLFSVWPVARVGLGIIFRRKLFWGLYALSLLFFAMFFFGQYLLAYAETENLPPIILANARAGLHLDGSATMYSNFFRFQSSMVVIVLALAGSILVGNDFHYGSLPFYLSKPLGRWHYLGGKFLAAAVFINMMTTVPALLLFAQFGMITSWDYFVEESGLLLGILAYGAELTVAIGLLLLATATWLRRTIPLIMVWTAVFFFLRQVGFALVFVLDYSPRWRLIDLWNDTWLVGNALLGIPPERIWPGRGQPPVFEALLVLVGVSLACVMYLSRRIRAVEIVR
jgi:ABC-type transport system involved in multi-copper enzyme maturation permease subunit